jgi:hypothetical protein
MPVISRFYGITIRINSRDHLPPHFHAEYGDDDASIEIATGQILAGVLRPRTRRLVEEWLDLHRTEVLENWNCAQTGRPCFGIEAV